MKVLHLSDTSLSGAPYRLSGAFSKYTEHKSRHIVWNRKWLNRVFKTDLVGEDMKMEELQEWWAWADIVHYHNRAIRSEFIKKTKLEVKSKPAVLQIHSPRSSENFKEELNAKIPIAVIAQYHPREWPELNFIVPNVVDIFEKDHMAAELKYGREKPLVAFTPSSVAGTKWDDKGFSFINPILKDLDLFQRRLIYKRMVGCPHDVVMELKRGSNIGIDEVITGSYHMSSLEFLSCGTVTMANIDEKTEKTVKDLTGCDDLPWVRATRANFRQQLDWIIKTKSWDVLGRQSRDWMVKYWHPTKTCAHFVNMYERIL